MMDQGKDPRQVKVEEETEKEIKAAELKKKRLCEAVTLEQAWQEYVEERKPIWSASHLHDHMRAMHAGGVKRTRSNKKFTEPGILFALSSVICNW
jgi:hypothetical protein